MDIKNHYLTGTFAGRKVKQLHCDKQSKKLEYPELIILHYTLGGNAMSSAHYLARKDTDESAHLVIGRDGGIIQLLPFDTVAWHAGQGEYEGRRNLNQNTIGITLDNAGELHRRNGRFYSWFNKEYMPDEVYTDCVNGRAHYWQRYTETQVKMAYDLCCFLSFCYPIHDVLGYSEVCKRKSDPGAAFPLEEFKKQLKKMLEH